MRKQTKKIKTTNMDRPNYTEPRMEVLLLTVEAGFAGSFEMNEKAYDDGFDDAY